MSGTVSGDSHGTVIPHDASKGPAPAKGTPFDPAAQQPASARSTGKPSQAGITPSNDAGQPPLKPVDLFKPDAVIVGVSTGKAVVDKYRASAFLITPFSHPFAGQKSAFLSRTYMGKGPKPIFSDPKPPFGIPGATVSGVATYNFTTKRAEPGFGGTVGFNVGPEPVIGFVNARAGIDGLDKDGNIRPHFNGVLSLNAGIAFQLNRPVGAVMKVAGEVMEAIPEPHVKAAGAGVQLGGEGVKDLEKVAQAWGGVAYRVEAHVQDGHVEGYYYKGQRIGDFGQFFTKAFHNRGQHQLPPPAHRTGPAAKLHEMFHHVFGGSPWHHHAAASEGGGAAGVAHQWREGLLEFGQHHVPHLPHDVRMTVLGGPQTNADAAKAASTLLERLDPEQATAFAGKLSNPYGIDFGVPAVKQRNEALAHAVRPDDYDDVRDVFNGAHGPHDAEAAPAEARPELHTAVA